jgi:uncharacterized protein with HEPN domain
MASMADEISELQEATEELLRLGARTISSEQGTYSWDEARDRLGMDEAIFKRAVTVFYGTVEHFPAGPEGPRITLSPLRPEPQAMALLPDPQNQARPAAALFRDPWEIVDLNRPDLTLLVDEVERTSLEFDEVLTSWVTGWQGGRGGIQLPRGLVQAGRAFRAARISLAKPLFVIAERKLTTDADLLPATSLQVSDELYLANIRLYCDRIVATNAKGKEWFLTEADAHDAVMRRLEIIGEAAGKLSPDFRAQHDHIPWAEIIGLRQVLAHNLIGNVPDLERVWSAAATDVPRLKIDLFGGWP